MILIFYLIQFIKVNKIEIKIKMLRRLGESESMFASGNIATTAAYIATSKVGLYANISQLEKAIDEWQRHDQFLQVRLQKTDEGYVFVQVPVDEFASKRNVEFLRLNRTYSREDEAQIWRGLVELEPKIDMDAFNGLLWRLKFLELLPQDGLYQYMIVFTVHHSISEGRAHMLCLQQLFVIYESIQEGTYVPSPMLEITTSFFDLYKETFGKELMKTSIPNLTEQKKSF